MIGDPRTLAPIAMLRVGLLAVVLLGVSACSSTPKRDLNFERISSTLAELDADATLGPLAPAERARAQAALRVLAEFSAGDDKQRVHLGYLAERRVDIALAAAQAEDFAHKLTQLEREHDQILLEASRRDAEMARLETEKLRLQSLARAEEAERALLEVELERERGVAISQEADAVREEAQQARRVAEAQARENDLMRREAELAGAAAESLRIQLQSMTARRGAAGLVMTLGDVAFASGQALLKAEARANLGTLVEFVNQDPAKSIRIEGHTDSTGSANANQVLSQKRAEAVRDALIAEGVAAGRIRALGSGEDAPVAPNDSEEGRARNRRVDVILED